MMTSFPLPRENWKGVGSITTAQGVVPARAIDDLAADIAHDYVVGELPMP